MQRIIVKLGTQVVIEESDGTPATQRLEKIISECAELQSSGNEILLVSSGAVGLGKKALRLSRALELHEKQACAALGQGLLMHMYSELFSKHRVQVAQVLVTSSDFSDRERYLNLKNCFSEFFRLGIIPIINENDVVSTAGIVEQGNAKSFDDNDRLSSIVAAKIQADKLIILTNVAGVFSDNPSKNPEATFFKTLEVDGTSIRTDGLSENGRGGMASKLQAARSASLCGVDTIISSGFIHNPIQSALTGASGTLIPNSGKLNSRSTWIGIASGHQGVIIVNACTALAFRSENKISLLPIGVIDVVGEFSVKDTVSIQDENGAELARGLASMSAATLRTVRGLHSEKAKDHLLKDEKSEVIHRDNMVILA